MMKKLYFLFKKLISSIKFINNFQAICGQIFTIDSSFP